MLTIALIGAPNTGKSTFFNKLIGGRRSIVENIPGVTRDRIYAQVNLGRWSSNPKIKDLQIKIIDTGGLFFEADTLFEGVQRQAETALKEADLILFVADGKIGITSIDRQIAKLLRREEKPIFLLANKLDSPELENLSADFYNLGMGEPLAFSSLGNSFPRSIDNLIDKIYEKSSLKDQIEDEQLLEKENEENDEEKPAFLYQAEDLIKVAILGKPNVGKSSLLNKLVGYERSLVHDVAGTTRDALDTELIFEEQNFLLIDTAGLRRKSKIYDSLERYSVDRSIKALVRADISVLVIDAKEGVANQEKKLAALIQKRKKCCIIALNKWDLIEKDNDSFKTYQELIYQELGFISYAPLIITSAFTGQRIEGILEQCIKVNKNYQRRISTGLLNNVLREIASINDPAKSGAKGLKVYYMTQVETKPPTFALFVNDPKYISENYLRFLEKCLRKEFEFEGVPFDWVIKKSSQKTQA